MILARMLLLVVLSVLQIPNSGPPQAGETGCAANNLQNLRFSAETIFFDLYPDALSVDAIYRFENRGAQPLTTPIHYPLAVDLAGTIFRTLSCMVCPSNSSRFLTGLTSI